MYNSSTGSREELGMEAAGRENCIHLAVDNTSLHRSPTGTGVVVSSNQMSEPTAALAVAASRS